MAMLKIRKLDNRIYKQLQLQAAKHGISMEEAVSAPERITAIFRKHFGEKNGIVLANEKDIL